MTNENKIEWIKNDLVDNGFGCEEMEAVEELINYHSENFSYDEIEKEELELDSFKVLYSNFFGHFPDYDGNNYEGNEEENDYENEYDMVDEGNNKINYENKPYNTQDFRERYVEGIGNENTILGSLNTYLSYSDVAKKNGWGINYDEFIDLCSGYVYGTPKMKGKIIDFLEDINFHNEVNRLCNDTDNFITEALDENSKYVKEFWG